ncbi:MAG: hypothetical protein DI538_10060 [Azospira oryzae]|jgi:hypothetical protein|nr:MAG: hypothetical protein DI538_10060 [Azospira oryzae]
MKREEQISLLLAAWFAYSLYRWSITLYTIFSGSGLLGFSFQMIFYCLTLLIGVGGLLQFYFSRFKKSQLLRLYLIYVLVSSLLGYIPSVARLFMGGDESSLFFIPLMIETAELVISFFALSVLATHRTPRVQQSTQEDGSVTLHYVPVSKGTRFLNRLFDALLFILIIYHSYQWWAYTFESFFDNTGYEVVQFMIVLLEYFLMVVYYLIMEYFFHTSFGKVFTQTTVINAQGGYPSFTTTLVRSLCRLIPFDSLSFLFGNGSGWHDRLSNTGVVEDKYVD